MNTQVEAFLRRKWAREHGYRLIKEIWAHDTDRIAVRFATPASTISPSLNRSACFTGRKAGGRTITRA